MSAFNQFEKYNLSIFKNGARLPEIKISDEDKKKWGLSVSCSNKDYLKTLAWNGYLEKSKSGIIKQPREECINRLKFEFEVLEKTGTIDYILLLMEIFLWCDKNDIIRCILGPTKKVLLNDISKKSYFAHSFFQKKELIHFQGEYFKSWKLPPIFVPYRNLTRKPPLFKKPLMVWSFMRKPDFFKVDPNINILYSRFPIQIQEKKELFLRNYIKKWKNIPISSSVYAKKEKENYILQFRKNEPFYLFKKIRSILAYRIPENVKFLPRKGSFIDLGEPITEGIIDIHELLTILFEYHSTLDGLQKGTKRCLTKFQLLLVHSIQSIYQSQGVTISTKHIEIIVKQMTSKVVIKESGDTPLLPGELIRFSLVNQIYESLKKTNIKL
jgi:hypothetical protein